MHVNYAITVKITESVSNTIMFTGDSSSKDSRLGANDVRCHKALRAQTAAGEGVGECGHQAQQTQAQYLFQSKFSGLNKK